VAGTTTAAFCAQASCIGVSIALALPVMVQTSMGKGVEAEEVGVSIELAPDKLLAWYQRQQAS